MPDWELKLWNMDNFDVNSVPFVKEAVAARKWAFAADYIRTYALYTDGGVYLDSDVFVRKSLDFVLENRAFSAIESFPDLVEKIHNEHLLDADGNKLDPNSKIHGLQIQAAIIGAEKGHPFFRNCLDYYQSIHLGLEEDGSMAEDKISPIVFAGIAEKYGFKYLDKEQNLAEGFKLYSSDLFSPQPYLMKDCAVAVHCCNGSWRHQQKWSHKLKERVKSVLINLGIWENKAIRRLE